MIRFALIAASTLGFFLTAALGNFMVPLLRAFGPGQEPRHRRPLSCSRTATRTTCRPRPPRPWGASASWWARWQRWAWAGRPPAWQSLPCWGMRACGPPGSSSRCLGRWPLGAVGLADDLARLRRHAPLGLRRPVRLGLEAAAAAAVQVLLAANHCLATGLVLPGLGYCELGVLAPIVWGAAPRSALPRAPGWPMERTAWSAGARSSGCWALWEP